LNTALSLGMNTLKEKDPHTKKGTIAANIISQQQATFTLGPAATSPLELTGAYAAVANDGRSVRRPRSSRSRIRTARTWTSSAHRARL